ncbi:MAG: hypothetical protein ACR2MK_02630 [Solirubrobacteraceae bacterium]
MEVLPALYAHHVGRAYGPGSSLAALSRAPPQPLDDLETDCCLTADGKLVLLQRPAASAPRCPAGPTSAQRRRSAQGAPPPRRHSE